MLHLTKLKLKIRKDKRPVKVLEKTGALYVKEKQVEELQMVACVTKSLL